MGKQGAPARDTHMLGLQSWKGDSRSRGPSSWDQMHLEKSLRPLPGEREECGATWAGGWPEWRREAGAQRQIQERGGSRQLGFLKFRRVFSSSQGRPLPLLFGTVVSLGSS